MTPDLPPASPRPRAFVVSPVYYDVECFRELRGRAARELTALDRFSSIQFVLVDDTAGEDPAVRSMGRDDGTLVITPPYNLGHQGAIVFALRELTDQFRPDDIVITMDADGEDRPEDVRLLLAPLLGGDDSHLLAIARRTKRKERLPFKIAYALFRLVFRVATGVVVRSGNFAAARGALIARTIDHPSFDQCYSASLISLPFRRRYVPLARGTRYVGTSRMNYLRLITHGIHMFMPFLEAIAVRLLIASSVGFVLALLALLWVAGQYVTTAAGMTWVLLVAVVALHGTLLSLLVCLTLFATSAQSKAQRLRILRH
jgi:glycosyltransferase involved in cell wall biosynthesis